MPPEHVRVRPIADADWEAIAELEHRAYTGHGLSEGGLALKSRYHASPATCLAVSAGDRLAGYAIALPYPAFTCPELSTVEQTAFASDNLHLHDLVIVDELRGHGLATTLLGRLTSTAHRRGHRRMSLVAVAGSAPFWSARGYRRHQEVVVPGSYGATAVYMTRALTPSCQGS
ncbi:MAG: hypothetical protein QOF58_4502 [Pseudonocardiales bacterium]|nr:hypothetical protein [Pseudonocardiales bacterium]